MRKNRNSVPAAVSAAEARVKEVAMAFIEDTLPSAETALSSAKYAERLSDEPKFKGDREHWEKIVAALKWMRGKTGAFARRYIRRNGDVNGLGVVEPRE